MALLTRPARTGDALPSWDVGRRIGGATRALRHDPLGALLEPYRELGPVFRARIFGKDRVVIAGLEANDVAWRDADQWDWQRSGAVFREQFGPGYLTQLAGAAHTAKRKRLSPAFRTRSLQRLVPAMREVWDEELSSLHGEVVDLRDLCKRLVVRMNGRALLQVDLPEGSDRDISILEHDLLFGATLGPMRHAWFRRPSYQARRRRFEGVVGALVQERLGDPSGDDALSEILRCWPDDAPPPTVDELVGDLVLLLQAGSESTAHQILWSLLLLDAHPAARDAVRVEVDGADLDGASLWTGNPSLRAAVLESERLRPAIPMARRIAAHDIELASATLRAGTPVLHATTLTHFLDEIYTDPFAYRPERFAGGRDAPHRAHGTFGGGSHVCLGQPLARVQVPLAVAAVLSSWEMVPQRPISLAARLTGVVTPVEDALPVRFLRARR